MRAKENSARRDMRGEANGERKGRRLYRQRISSRSGRARSEGRDVGGRRSAGKDESDLRGVHD